MQEQEAKSNILKKKSVQQLKKAADEKREEFNRKVKECNKKVRLELMKKVKTEAAAIKKEKDLSIQEKMALKDV